MSQPTFSRRSFLLGAGAAAVGGPAFLAACGSGGGGGGAAGEKGSTVNFANWPFYIEDDKKPTSGATLKDFTEATGIKVNYKVAVDDNNDFTEKSRGQLEKGNYIGYDLTVLTSWMVARWIKNGWTETFDAANIPNKANVLDSQAGPSWDPQRTMSLPYAIGQVGIAYYPEKTGFEITSAKDLLDPRVKGRVTLLSEVRDCAGLFMLANGADPSKADLEGAKKAIDEIKKARDAGQFRAIKGNSYIEDLDLGDVYAAVAWSGDVASIQKDHPDLKWVLPKDGAMSFVDTFLIPKGAKNKAGAEKLINHFYDPAVSGPLFETIQYVSPVKGAGAKMSADAAKNPLVNPPADAKIYEFADLTEEQAEELETLYDEATKL
jgi:spermidine/putrescine transport system substrate-binding protein